MYVGIRFADLGIPQGATITSAFIEFTASEVQEGATNVTILGEYSDDAKTYNGDDFEISTRPLAPATVSWNGIPPWSVLNGKHQTPDLKAIVQAIVNRPGWNPSHAMAFMFTGSGRRTAWSYDGAPTMAPRLVVNYEGQVACTTLTSLTNPFGAGQITTDPAPNCGANQFYQGTTVQLTAVPTALNYSFASWTGGATGSANPTTIVMAIDQTVTADFVQGTCHTLTRNVVILPDPDPTAGEIRPDPLPNCGDGTKAGKYKNGTVVMLNALAKGGWEFTEWSGALTGSDRPQPLTMDADKTVTATFVAGCRRLKMTIDPPGGGTVTYTPPPNCGPDTWQSTIKSVKILGVPAPGHFFVKWKGDVDGGETLANPTTVIMNGNKSVNATFRFSAYVALLPSIRKQAR